MSTIGPIITLLVLGALALIGLGTVGGWIANAFVPRELRIPTPTARPRGQTPPKAAPPIPNRYGAVDSDRGYRPAAPPSPPPPPSSTRQGVVHVHIQPGPNHLNPVTKAALLEVAERIMGNVDKPRGPDEAARAEQIALHAKALVLAIESDNVPRPKVHTMIWRAVTAASYPRDIS